MSIALVVEGLVPLSKAFKFVNHGNMPSNENLTENKAQFLPISPITNHRFQLCFYTTTKSKSLFTLGLSMGGGRSRTGNESIRRWVWAANPNKPVGKNATLIFRSDGNLILADTNGRAVWQTQTSNKGVTDIKLLSNGNLVLQDETGNFVWQSFHYPTDTLLNGQGLTVHGPTKLVSGSYSMDVEPYPALFFRNKKYPRMIYHTLTDLDYTFEKVSFFARSTIFGLVYEGRVVSRDEIWEQQTYNTTMSMLRLEKNGGLLVYSFNEHRKTWESIYPDVIPPIYGCDLPEKCGVFGLCKNQTCVSCPSSKGLMATSWSKECKREKIPHCNSTTSEPDYYKLENISSSLRTSSNKDYMKMTVNGCKKKCILDCKCTGLFYRTEEGTCMVATGEIYTLTSDPIQYKLGDVEPKVDTYIKYAKPKS